MTLAIAEAALVEADFALEIFADLKAAEAVGHRRLLVVLLVLLVWSWAAFDPFEAALAELALAEAEVAAVGASVLTLELALSTLLEPEIKVFFNKVEVFWEGH